MMKVNAKDINSFFEKSFAKITSGFEKNTLIYDMFNKIFVFKIFT